jgi:hypothetical protein
MKIRTNEVMVVKNRLMQVGLSFKGNRNSERMAVFKCSCGVISIVSVKHVKSGDTQSCGCFAIEQVKKRSIGNKSRLRHGGCGSREHVSWKSMRSRCLNENVKAYADYGGRGISVCERWDSFENFIEDMGPRPSGTSIDRVDNNGNYEPGNCRWATRKQQSNNTRRNTFIEVNGVSKTISQWSMHYGVNVKCIIKRLSRPHIWSAEAAVSTPSRRVSKSV